MDKIRIELSRRHRLLAVAPLAYVAALVSSGVRAPIASAATDYCNPRGLSGDYYGAACLFAPSGTTFMAVSGYIESSELSTPNDGSHVIDDMYIVNPYANPPPPETNVPDFIEAGIFSGNICTHANHNFGDCTPSGYQERLLFWGDDPQGSDYNAHFEGVASLGTQYVDEIDHEPNSDVWEVALGSHLGYSTNDPLEPSLIRTGTEEAPGSDTTSQNEADACSEQSDLWYADQNYNWHDGWGSASAVVYDSPPYAKWYTTDSAVLDWAWGGQDYGDAYDSCWPNGFAPANQPSSGPVSPPTNPTSWPSASSEAGTPLTEAQVLQIAEGFAGGMGDAAPTSIEYVKSTRQQAVSAESGDEVSSNADVYAIVMQGNFVASNAPSAGGAPTGSVLTMVIGASTGTLTDFGIGNQVPDLTSLGPVTTAQ
jgi:hypothetical protein